MKKMPASKKVPASFFLFFVLTASAVQAAPADILSKVSVQQKLNQQLPLNTVFYNENGQKIRLQDYFTGKPVLMTFIYYNCPMLCPLNLQKLAQGLKSLDLTPGKDYQLLAISFDPDDMGKDAKAQLNKFLNMLGRPAHGGIHFLTGPQSSIQQVTSAAGFQYAKNEDTGQYAHTTALVAVTPQGRIARYFFGLDYPPRDIKLALTEAQGSRIGSLSQAILLYCFCYNPVTGRYTLAILNILKVMAFLTLVVLALLFYLLKKQEKEA